MLFRSDKCNTKPTSKIREVDIKNHGRTWIALFHNYVYPDFFSSSVHLVILIFGLVLSVCLTIFTKTYRKSMFEKAKLKSEQEKKDLEIKLTIENLKNENQEKTEFMSMISH